MTKASEAVQEKSKYSIKGLKTMQGHDGLVIRCNLYFENTKVAECYDDGNGGMLDICFDKKYNEKTKTMEPYMEGAKVQFEKFIEDYPEEPVDTSEEWRKELYPTGFRKISDEVFIGSLVDRELRSKDLKKALKKNVLFINKKDEMREFSYKGKPVITQGHIENYRKTGGAEKDEVVSILNEMPFEIALNVYEAHSG